MEINSTDLIWIITLGIALMGMLALTMVLFFQFSRKKLLQEQLRQQELLLEHQQELSINAIRVQDRERTRIARDLHDDIGAKLNAALLYLRQTRKKVADDQAVQDQILETEEIINRVINTNRHISHDLLPPTLDALGTRAAIQELGRDFSMDGGPQVEVVWDSELADLPKKSGIHLFRVLQELIKNSLTHGQAEHISVHLQPATHGPLRLSYEDDGKGFDLNRTATRKRGLGSSNIETRLQALGLQLQVHTAPGSGYRAYTEALPPPTQAATNNQTPLTSP